MDQKEIEQRLHMLVGRLVIENELLQLRIGKLEVQVAANSKPEPEPEPPKEPV